MILYQIDSGVLTIHKGSLPHYLSYCYSGFEECKNKSNKVHIKGRGPIPPGSYRIGLPFTSPNSGPITMRLTPLIGTNTHGRGSFEIHGDSIEHPGQASQGCICANKATRLRIAAAVAAHDDELLVTP